VCIIGNACGRRSASWGCGWWRRENATASDSSPRRPETVASGGSPVRHLAQHSTGKPRCRIGAHRLCILWLVVELQFGGSDWNALVKRNETTKRNQCPRAGVRGAARAAAAAAHHHDMAGASRSDPGGAAVVGLGRRAGLRAGPQRTAGVARLALGGAAGALRGYGCGGYVRGSGVPRDWHDITHYRRPSLCKIRNVSMWRT
jgi:hypothetical protein